MRSPQLINSELFINCIRIQLDIKGNSKYQKLFHGEQICSKTGTLREVMHIFYTCGTYMGIFIKTKPQVLSEAMGNSRCEHLPHSGEHGKISSQDLRVCMEFMYSYHKAFRGEKTLSAFW